MATGSWPQFQYDDANTGHAPTNSGPTAEVGSRLAVDVDRGAGTAPAVAGDLVYVAGGDETLYAINRTDGTTRWTASAQYSAAWPSVYGNTVYLPGSSVTALDAASGEERWSTSVEGSVNGVVQRGDTVVAAGRGGVTVIDAKSSNVRWHNDEVSMWREPPAVVDSDVFAVDSSAGTIISLHTGGGRQWLRHFDGPAPGGPTVEDELVIVPGGSAVYAYDRSTGVEQWTVSESLEATVAAGNGHAYGVTGDELVAMTLDGDVAWRTAIPTTTNPPVVAGGRIYLAGDDGTVVAANEADGSIHWQASVGSKLRSAFAVAGGELYATTRDGSLQMLAEGAGSDPATATEAPDSDEETATATATQSDPATATRTADEEGSADSGLLAMLGSAGLATALYARGRAALGDDD